ncbi:MAG: hypothetical protein ACKVP3_10495 [Hyphomicrobiaceae bacterium]
MPKVMLVIAVAVVFAGGANPGWSQDKPDSQSVKEIQRQDTLPPATGGTQSEQAGKAEPSSKIPHTNPHPNVFVNGVLSVPGAMTDVDTAPAKFSARTNADDQVTIAGYRLKHLTSEQRSEIVQALGSQREAPAAGGNGGLTTIGAEIPSSVAEAELTPMPEWLTGKFPGLRGTGFMRTAGKVLIVDLDDSRVVGVL